MKATEQYFPVALFIMLYKVVLSFDFGLFSRIIFYTLIKIVFQNCTSQNNVIISLFYICIKYTCKLEKTLSESLQDPTATAQADLHLQFNSFFPMEKVTNTKLKMKIWL